MEKVYEIVDSIETLEKTINKVREAQKKFSCFSILLVAS